MKVVVLFALILASMFLQIRTRLQQEPGYSEQVDRAIAYECFSSDEEIRHSEIKLRRDTSFTRYPGLFAEVKPEGFDYYSGELPSRNDPKLKMWFHLWQITWSSQTPAVLMPKAAAKERAKRKKEENIRLLAAEAHRLAAVARFEEETSRMPPKKRAALKVIWLGNKTVKDASLYYGINFNRLNVAWYRLQQRVPECVM